MTNHIDVPAERRAIFSNDGRVFMDMDYMIAQFDEFVSMQEKGAKFTQNPADDAYVEGSRAIIDMLIHSKEVLVLDDAFES
ncbi:hypothetical protein ncot_11905 [Nocardioides sp. JQ2195]|uniref:hypothetical protein n=1 Tax=Nocardioides sp. JQ2195 TaxID=2592334 RepID=UPI00143EBE48|nr:hypothetical protein [Nocardioides sp. JQ2195]QIX27224.1 hypothetical protein ncot_11905 [Nocardioides sp. JQ2195]